MNKRNSFTVRAEQAWSPYTGHAMSGLPNPTHLEGGGVRFVQAQVQQVTIQSPKIITECLLTRSVLINCMYMTFFFGYIVFQFV